MQSLISSEHDEGNDELSLVLNMDKSFCGRMELLAILRLI